MAAALKEGSLSQMHDLLTCPICLETFVDPRTLPCFHSYCKTCLEKFVKKQRDKADGNVIEEFNCPTCRSIFVLKSKEDVAGMSSNYLIRNLLDAMQIQNETCALRCSSCEKEQSVRRCTACNVFMCQKCSEEHERMATGDEHKQHDVVSLKETDDDNRTKHRRKVRCVKHNKTMKFYCEVCKQLVCRYCMEDEHVKQDHPCLHIDLVVEKKRVCLTKSLRALQGRLAKGNQALQAVTDVQQRLEENLQRAKDDVERQKENVLETFKRSLEQTAQEKGDELDLEYDKVNEPLDKQCAALKSYVEKVKVTVELTASLLEHGYHEAISSSYEVIGKRVEELDKERPRPMKPVHCGHIQYVSKPTNDRHFTATFKNFGDVVSAPLVHSLHNTSEILKEQVQYVEQMESWMSDLCKWRLCYRATRDGWSAESFHARCDNIGPTVTLVKTGDFIFGGYTDQNWEGTGYKESNASFLFSLRNNDDLPPFKAPIFQYFDYAIWNNPNYGPSFGYGYYGCDLYISNNSNITTQSYTNFGYLYKPPEGYPYRKKKTQALLAGSYYFQPTEIEVFF